MSVKRKVTVPAGSPATRQVAQNASDAPDAGLLHELVVGVQPAAAPQVLDDVPVNGAHVLAAVDRVGAADREVDGAADLLVEAHVARVALDRRVAADPELAQTARALV